MKENSRDTEEKANKNNRFEDIENQRNFYSRLLFLIEEY